MLRQDVDGVWFGFADSSVVRATIATAIGVCEKPRHPILTTLIQAIASQRYLVVLDNCEHLARAGLVHAVRTA